MQGGGVLGRLRPLGCDLSLSRRDFIVATTAAIVLPSAGLAQDGGEPAAFSAVETVEGFRFRLLSPTCEAPLDLVVSKRYWGASPSGRTGQRPTNSTTFELRGRNVGNAPFEALSLTIRNARFGGADNVTVFFAFDVRGIDCRVMLRVDNWPRAGRSTHFGSLDFEDFVSETATFTDSLSAAEVKQLLGKAFGPAIEAKGGAILSLSAKWLWSLDGAAGFAALGELGPGAGAPAVRFRKLEFSPTAQQDGILDKDILKRLVREPVDENAAGSWLLGSETFLPPVIAASEYLKARYRMS